MTQSGSKGLVLNSATWIPGLRYILYLRNSGKRRNPAILSTLGLHTDPPGMTIAGTVVLGLVLTSAVTWQNSDAKRPGMHSRAKSGNEGLGDFPNGGFNGQPKSIPQAFLTNFAIADGFEELLFGLGSNKTSFIRRPLRLRQTPLAMLSQDSTQRNDYVREISRRLTNCDDSDFCFNEI